MAHTQQSARWSWKFHLVVAWSLASASADGQIVCTLDAFHLHPIPRVILPSPVRYCQLMTGEVVPAEVLWLTNGVIELRGDGHHRRLLPRSWVIGFENPEGEIDVWHSPVKATSIAWADETGVGLEAGTLTVVWSRCDVDHTSAEVRLAFPVEPSTQANCMITQTTGQPLQLHLPTGWTTTFQQPVRSSSANLPSLEFTWATSTWCVVVGDAVLAEGRRPATRLKSVTIKPGTGIAANTRPGGAVLRGSRAASKPTTPSLSPDADILELQDGRTLHGHVRITEDQTLELEVPAGTLQVPWNQFRRVTLRQAILPDIELPALGGPFNALTWNETPELSFSPAVVLQRWPGEEDCRHPLLGPLDGFARSSKYSFVDSREFRWLYPRQFGLRPAASPGGDDVIILGQGTWWQDQLRPAAAHVDLTVRPGQQSWQTLPGLLPSLPHLPPTDLWVNGQFAISWSDLLSKAPPLLSRTNLRATLRPGLLRQGRNVWELRQAVQVNSLDQPQWHLGPLSLTRD